MDYFTISQDISLIHAVELDRGFIPEAWKKEIVKGRSVEFEFGKLPAQNHNFLVREYISRFTGGAASFAFNCIKKYFLQL